MAESERKSYSQFLVATSVFGGLQIFVILIGIVKTKFVAILLGVKGVGTLGLFNSPISLISGLTNLGLNYSAVRELARTDISNAGTDYSLKISLIRKLFLVTGFLGAFLTMMLSPLISLWTFGDSSHWLAICFLGVAVLINSLTTGSRVIFQSFRLISVTGRATIVSSLIGLFLIVPLYAWFGSEAIVSSIVLASVVSWLSFLVFERNLPKAKASIPPRDLLSRGIPLIKEGFPFIVTSIFASLANYVLSIYLARRAGIEALGLYSAGWSIIGQYVGVIFSAMTTDYFARLAKVSDDNAKVRVLINQQAEMAVLVLAPMLVLMIFISPILVNALYSKEFLPAIDLINWMTMGMFIKGIVWSIGFAFPAKGDTKLFMTIEVLIGLMSLALNILSFEYFGLNGLGISFCVNYIISIVVVFLVAYKKYSFYFSSELYKLTIFLGVLLLLAFINGKGAASLQGTLYGVGLLIISTIYVLYELHRRIDLRIFFRSYTDKFRK